MAVAAVGCIFCHLQDSGGTFFSILGAARAADSYSVRGRLHVWAVRGFAPKNVSLSNSDISIYDADGSKGIVDVVFVQDPVAEEIQYLHSSSHICVNFIAAGTSFF